MNDKGEQQQRWIVTYRRYSTDQWKEVVFRSETNARQFAEDKRYDHNVEVIVRRFIEA